MFEFILRVALCCLELWRLKCCCRSRLSWKWLRGCYFHEYWPISFWYLDGYCRWCCSCIALILLWRRWLWETSTACFIMWNILFSCWSFNRRSAWNSTCGWNRSCRHVTLVEERGCLHIIEVTLWFMKVIAWSDGIVARVYFLNLTELFFVFFASAWYWDCAWVLWFAAVIVKLLLHWGWVWCSTIVVPRCTGKEVRCAPNLDRYKNHVAVATRTIASREKGGY